MKRTASATWMVLGALAVAPALTPRPARACDFCDPGSVSLLMALRQADAAVAVELVGKKLKFVADAPALADCQFKVVSVLSGTAKPETGAVFRAVVDPKKIGTATKALAMVTMVNKTINALDVFPDAEGRLIKYVTTALALPSQDGVEAVGFFADHLEDADAVISADAQGQFFAIPFEKVREGAKVLPADKIRAWLASDKTNLSRKGLYGLMLGTCGKAEDVEVLKTALAGASENGTAAGGLLAGWAILTNKPRAVLEPVITDGKQPMAVRKAALNVSRFLMTKLDASLKPEILELFRAGLADKKTAEFAVEELARAGEFGLSEDVKKLWLDKDRSTHNVRIFVRFYGAVMPTEQRKEFTKWLEAHPAPQPPAED